MQSLNQEEVFRITENMIKYGGSFVKNLGKTLGNADPINQKKIKETWPEYWKQYDHKWGTIEKKAKFLKCFIDGDNLAVVRDDFVNMQESPAVFVKLDTLRISRISELEDGVLK